MKAIRQIRVPVLATTFVLLAGICSGGQAGKDLIINGQVATSDLKVINGRTYAPLADIAKALGMSLVNKPNGIEMTKAGGAGPVEGLHAKIGEQIFTGRWRFTPVSLDQMDSYTEKYTGEGNKITPTNPGETLYVLSCQVKNGEKEMREMVCSTRICGHTALTDDMQHGYAPHAYDAHNETGPYGGPKLLPGAAADFAVIFSVPKGASPKDIIFTIISDQDLHEETKEKLGTDLRISIKP